MMEMLTAVLKTRSMCLPDSLRLVMMSGDWIPLGLPDQIRANADGIPEIISLGGATEASIWSIWYPIGSIQPEWRSIPYGRPLSNQRFHVLDRHLNPLPVGAIGELYIGGIGVARGYLGSPDLTRERFLSDPFSHDSEDRLYRTGDLGRYFSDGTIEFLGRMDAQVKIRGYRIELGEIELCLSRHPAVAEAIVLARELHQGKKDLVAYVVAKNRGDRLSTAALQEYLRKSLPEYMVPVAYIGLDHFPMTVNGKLDREALPMPDHARHMENEQYLGPRTELEATLCKLWSEVLGVHPVGIHDDFFSLGGHSLLAVTLLGRIEQALGRELPMEVMLHAGSVARMAEILAQDDGLPADIVVPLRLEGEAPPLFCIHPVGGNVLAYRELAARLRHDLPVFGIRAVGLRRDEAPLSDLREMAQRYQAALQRIQPHGPYRLCGWSLGGIIALEVACQLRSAGESVERVIMIDSYSQETGRDNIDRAMRLAWMARDLGGMAGVDLEPTADEFGSDLSTLDAIVARSQALGVLPIDTAPDQIKRLFEVFECNLEAMFRYHPVSYSGPVLLIHACGAPADHPAHPVAGWRSYIADLTAHYVEGNHYTLLQSPQVDQVAELINGLLR